jgi:hypothetical protein
VPDRRKGPRPTVPGPDLTTADRPMGTSFSAPPEAADPTVLYLRRVG